MSITALNRAFAAIECTELKPSSALVLLCLARRHNQETGRCDPSLARIAKDSGLSVRAVRSGLRELEANRLIQTVFRKATTGRGVMNMNSRYRILGTAKSAATLRQNLPPKKEIYQPSAFDDLANLIHVDGGDDV